MGNSLEEIIGISELPNCWKESVLGNEIEISRKPNDLKISENLEFPYITMDMIPIDKLEISKSESRLGKDLRSGVFFKEGDLLLAKITPCLENGKQGIARDIKGGWGFATTEVYPVRAKQLDMDFLAFYLMEKKVRGWLSNRLQGATGRQRLPKESLLSLPIPVPPLAEQRAIAHVLRTIQRAIEATEKVIQAAKQLKQSLLQYLFTYGPEPFHCAERVELKETDFKAVPSTWKMFHFGEITSLKNGINFKAGQKGKGILTVDVLNMYREGLYVEMDNLYRIDIEPNDQYLLMKNDILFVRSSLKQEGVGWPALFPGYTEPVSFCGFLIRARVTSDYLDPEFLVNYFRLPQVHRALVSKSGKVAITNINQGNLSSIPVFAPSINAQKLITDYLEKTDLKLKKEEMKKNALNSLFISLLHNLMTGQIRVKDIDFP